MKKLLALSFIGTSLFLGSNPVKADWDNYSVDIVPGDTFKIYTCFQKSGNCTLKATRTESPGISVNFQKHKVM